MEPSHCLRRGVLGLSPRTCRQAIASSQPRLARQTLRQAVCAFSTESSSTPDKPADNQHKDLRSIIAALNSSAPQRQTQSPSSAFDAIASRARPTPTSLSNRNQFMWEQLRTELNRPQTFDSTPSIHLRLKPTLGRTFDVSPNQDVTKALRTLERKCSENKIKSDSLGQKFHTRRGQKRKIVRMRRWRALFKEGFVAECGKIRRMRRQGW